MISVFRKHDPAVALVPPRAAMSRPMNCIFPAQLPGIPSAVTALLLLDPLAGSRYFFRRMKTLRKPSETANSAPHGVLARCAVILEAIASHEGGLSLTRVMRLTGLSNATSHRLLGALVDIGYL